ncbi:hypothetical protein NECAME_05719, partial [Necator americanus]
MRKSLCYSFFFENSSRISLWLMKQILVLEVFKQLKAVRKSLTHTILAMLHHYLFLILLLTIPVRSNIIQMMKEDDCPLLKNGPILEVAEKICEFCHEISSHEKPNMRAECRAAPRKKNQLAYFAY